MTSEQRTTYNRLNRQVQEAAAKLYDQGTGGRIRGKSPNLYNNRLQRMKDFIQTLDGDYSNNTYMKLDKLTT